MHETPVHEEAIGHLTPPAVASAQCDECQGSGGWFRYEPALDPLPGRLYLSCLQCRGSGALLARG